MTEIPNNTASRHKDTASRIIDGEAVILRPMDNMILNLNETGSRIWELLAESPAIPQIVQSVCEEFEVGQETAAADVMTFLQKMEDKGLVRITPADQPEAQ